MERIETASTVAIKALGYRFASGLQALDGVDLDLGPGEFVSLVGASGCGKSTLLRILSGLLASDTGQVVVGGCDPLEARRSRHAFGFVFQSPNLLPWRTVLENVSLPLELGGIAATERKERSLDWIARVGLSEFAHAWPAQLSGGMKMRVSIARALAIRPRLLLMDEPFAALDDITRGKLQEDILRLRESERFTTLFVTHNVSEAAFLSDRVAVMTPRPGRIAREVPTDFGTRRDADLRGDPAFAAKVREIGRALAEVSP